MGDFHVFSYICGIICLMETLIAKIGDTALKEFLRCFVNADPLRSEKQLLGYVAIMNDAVIGCFRMSLACSR